MRTVTITLTQTDLDRLEEIRKIREAQGRPWYGIGVAVASATSCGIFEDLLVERSHAEALENPMRINERGSIDLIMRQAM